MAPKQVTHPSGTTVWQVRWRDPAGKQRSKNLPTKAKAEKFERNILSDLDRGDYRPPAATRWTVTTWADQWLAGALNLRDGGRDAYRRDLDRYIIPSLGDIRMDRLTAEEIERFLAEQAGLGRAPASVHRMWRTLRRMCNVAVERDVILRSPVDKVAAPRVPKSEMRFLSAESLEALAAAAADIGRARDEEMAGRARRSMAAAYRQYGPMVLAVGWGCLRWGEVAGLRHEAVDRARGGLRIVRQWTGKKWEDPKGGQRRFVSLPASVMDVIPEGQPRSLVFTSPTGRRLVHSNWRARVWEPAKKAAGVDLGLRPHDLRHTGAALAIAAGIHPEELRRRMGHSSITVTFGHYGHLLPGSDEAVAERLDAARAQARRPRLVS